MPLGPYWTKQEDQVLFELYQRYDVSNKEEILSRINRSWGSISRRAKDLGLFRGNYIPPLDRLPKYKPNAQDCIWLACAIDCEGNISLTKRKRRDLPNNFNLLPSIQFCNTNIGIVESFRNRTFPNEVKLRTLKRIENSHGKWKDKHFIIIARMPLVYSLLKKIKNNLIVKNKQAEAVMEFIKLENKRIKARIKYGQKYLDRQLEIFEEVRNLNGR